MQPSIRYFKGKHPKVLGRSATVGHACALHDHAFVGMGSTVLDGAVIESEGLLAAHSLLSLGKIIKSGEV